MLRNKQQIQKFLCVWNYWIFNYVNLIFNTFTVKIFSYTNSFCLLFYFFPLDVQHTNQLRKLEPGTY